jgi:phage terminase large subunit-like protein
MMEVQSAEDSIFNMKHIKFWEGNYVFDDATQMSCVVIDGEAIPVNVFAGVDPATDSMRRDSDFSVIMVVAVDENNNIYVLDYVRERGLPVLGIPGEDRDGIVDKMFNLAKIYYPSLYVVEDTTMSRPLFQALMAESRRRNDFSVKWREEKPGTRQSKLDRIQGVLAQRMTIGSIKIKKSHYDLQHEIVTFGPRMAHDDTIDALAYAVKYAYPPQNIAVHKDGTHFRKRKSPKNWVIA